MDSIILFQERIKKLFTLTGIDGIQWCDYSEFNPDQEKTIREKQAVSNAEDALNNIDIVNGFIEVNCKNIDLIIMIRDAILLVNHHDTGSWNRSRSMLLTNQLLSYCIWNGDEVEFEDCSDYDATSCTLNRKQLQYYLWWREEAKLGKYHICTHRLLWVYIYDLLTDTCYSNRSVTLNKLIEVEKRYLDLAPDIRPKSLTHQKLKSIIYSYVVYNNMWNSIKLLSNYEFEDDYNICIEIAKGTFKNRGEFIYSIATSKTKNKALNDKALHDEICMRLPTVFEKLYTLCIKQGINITLHLIGTLNTHSLWDPYELTYLTEETLKISAASGRKSFAYGENEYKFIEHDDMVSEKFLQSEVFSRYHNDDGTTTEKKYSYYRNHYSGATPEGHQIVDYIIRTIQNLRRNVEGKKSLQQLLCPYINIISEIDSIVKEVFEIQVTEQYDNRGEKMISFHELPETIVDTSSKFIYQRILSERQNGIITSNNDADTNTMLILKPFYDNLFEAVSPECRIEELNKEEIIGISIERDVNKEKEAGIEDIVLYLYHQYGELLMIGEIYAKEITKDFTFSFKVYDKENDIVECSDNIGYSGKHSGPFYVDSNTIKRNCFFNRYPFKSNFNSTKINGVTKIKMRIDIEDE